MLARRRESPWHIGQKQAARVHVRGAHMGADFWGQQCRDGAILQRGGCLTTRFLPHRGWGREKKELLQPPEAAKQKTMADRESEHIWMCPLQKGPCKIFKDHHGQDLAFLSQGKGDAVPAC